MLKVTITEKIDSATNIVLPISMNQPLEKGEYLKALLDEISKLGLKEKVTVLVCDYLNRHNTCSSKEALKIGGVFLEEHSEVLTGFKVVRWETYIKTKTDFKENLKTIIAHSKPGTLFYNKMRKTHDQCKSSNSLDASINYQREEFAAILSMHEFDALIYPHKMSLAMAFLYRHVEGKKPDFVQVKINKQLAVVSNDFPVVRQNFFKCAEKKNHNSMHLACRIALEQIKTILTSPEISEHSKKIFMDEIESCLFLKKKTNPNVNFKVHF